MRPVCGLTWTVERVATADRLLRRLAHRRWPSNTGGLQDDLVQAAWLRLLAERFDPSRGVPFEGWLMQRARWAMVDAQRGQGWLRQHRGRLRSNEPEIVSLEGQPLLGEVLGSTPRYHDPFLAQRIREAFGELPPRLRGFLLSSLTVGGRTVQAKAIGVCQSRGSQLAKRALDLFREALGRRGIRESEARNEASDPKRRIV